MAFRWLVIGIGDISTRRVIPAILDEPRSELYALLTRDPKKAEPYAAARVFTDPDEALADPAIDGVYVSTPVALHAPQTLAALKSGKHVLCEKPVAMNYSEAWRMVRAAEEAHRLLGVAYYRRLYPKVQRAAELLRQGAIGRPVLAEINFHSWFTDADGRRRWLLDPALAGGGPLFDVASHRIDVLNFLLGRPVSVTAQISNVVHATPVEDCATVLIEYEGGARGIVDVRWHSRIYRDEFRIAGTEGEIRMSPLNDPEMVYPGGQEELPVHANVHFPVVANFVAAALDGAALAAPGASAIWTDWVTEEAVRSASGRRFRYHQ